MTKEVKTQTPQPGIGPRRGNFFAETEYAKDIGWTLKRIGRYFLKEKKLIVSMLAAVLGGTLAGIYAPMLQSNAVDIIAGQRNGNLKTTLFFMLATYLTVSLMRLVQGVVSAKLSLRIVRQFREELFGKIIDLPVKYTDTHSHGDMMSRMTNDVENISVTVSQALPSLFSGILTIIGTAAIMLWYCWQLALLSCGTIFLTVIVTRLLSSFVRKYSKERQALLGKMNGTVEETVNGYHTVVAYNHQDESVADFCAVSDKLTKAGIRTEVCSGIMGPVMNCIGNIGFVIIAAFGGYFAVHGMISVGVISAFIVYAKQFSRPINEIAQIYGQLQSAIAGAERVFQVLDESSEDLYGLVWEDQEKVTVRFEDVEFGYVQGKPVLKDFNLTIPAGKKVALVGSTGSGKSTVVNLLMRYYDADKGAIWINGQNVEEITRDSLRKHVAIVLLLGGSGCGKTTFINAVTGSEPAKATIYLDGKDVYKDYDDMNHIIGVCPQGNIVRMNDVVEHTIEESAIIRLPKSVTRKEIDERLDSVLKRYGLQKSRAHLNSKLSGGQLRRLNIAMEYIADPDLFILDEPDSGLDGVMARDLMKSLREIADEGKIVLVITHNPDRVIDFFDDVIVLARDADFTGRLAFFGPIQEAREFFGRDSMEEILLLVNRPEYGGEGQADKYIEKYLRMKGWIHAEPEEEAANE